MFGGNHAEKLYHCSIVLINCTVNAYIKVVSTSLSDDILLKIVVKSYHLVSCLKKLRYLKVLSIVKVVLKIILEKIIWKKLCVKNKDTINNFVLKMNNRKFYSPQT